MEIFTNMNIHEELNNNSIISYVRNSGAKYHIPQKQNLATRQHTASNLVNFYSPDHEHTDTSGRGRLQDNANPRELQFTLR